MKWAQKIRLKNKIKIFYKNKKTSDYKIQKEQFGKK